MTSIYRRGCGIVAKYTVFNTQGDPISVSTGFNIDALETGDEVREGEHFDKRLVNGKLVAVSESVDAIRLKRNDLLQASDWTQLPDALTEEKRGIWAAYRKKLRDMMGEAKPTFPNPPEA